MANEKNVKAAVAGEKKVRKAPVKRIMTMIFSAEIVDEKPAIKVHLVSRNPKALLDRMRELSKSKVSFDTLDLED